MGPRQALPKLINSAFSGLFQLEPFHRLFRSGIIDSFKRYDREQAWPDAEFFIENVPPKIFGGVGGDSYTGWIYQQGFFAGLIRSHLPGRSLRIIDFGCGFGKLAPVSTFFTHPDGVYIGIDIRSDCIEACERQYAHLPRVEFHKSEDYNSMYSEERSDELRRSTPQHDWPAKPGSIDLVTAISVFTHLQEEQALHYFRQIHGVLKPNGVAMLTFHIVEEPRKAPKFSSANKPHLLDLFDFRTALPPSQNFFTSRPLVPEDAIAVNDAGLKSLIGDRFDLVSIIRGSTTGGEDPFFQDIVILRKK
jgi:SAM-dependent methyltransferase